MTTLLLTHPSFVEHDTGLDDAATAVIDAFVQDLAATIKK